MTEQESLAAMADQGSQAAMADQGSLRPRPRPQPQPPPRPQRLKPYYPPKKISLEKVGARSGTWGRSRGVGSGGCCQGAGSGVRWRGAGSGVHWRGAGSRTGTGGFGRGAGSGAGLQLIPSYATSNPRDTCASVGGLNFPANIVLEWAANGGGLALAANGGLDILADSGFGWAASGGWLAWATRERRLACERRPRFPRGSRAWVYVEVLGVVTPDAGEIQRLPAGAGGKRTRSICSRKSSTYRSNLRPACRKFHSASSATVILLLCWSVLLSHLVEVGRTQESQLKCGNDFNIKKHRVHKDQQQSRKNKH